MRSAVVSLFIYFAFALLTAVLSQSTPPTTSTTATPATNQTTETPVTNATTTDTPITTEKPTNATTTPAPTTTTVAPTLPPPTLPPSPSAPTSPWTVKHPNGSICILAEFAAQIQIKYNSSDKASPQLTTGFNIPANASVDSNASVCSELTHNTQVLALNFDIENQTTGSIRFTFNKSEDNVFVQNLTIVYQLTESLFPNYINKAEYNKTITVESDVSKLFKVDDSHSYRCKSKLSVTLNNTEPGLETYGAELDISDAKVQAYIQSDAKSNGTYSAEQNCESSQVSDVVPIAVGASLAALVVIVLIAYFVGRRRSRRLAYQSV